MSEGKTLRLKYKSGALLNPVADYILENKTALIERLAGFELVEGQASLFGSGEHAIVEIIIRYIAPTQEDLDEIEEIVAIAKDFGDELEISIS